MISESSTVNYIVLKKIEQTKAFIELLDNEIIYINIKDNAEIEIADSIEQKIFIDDNCGPNNRLILVHAGANTSITKEAREFASTDEANKTVLATAVIVKGLAQRILINFIMSVLNRKKLKMKLFSSKADAILWLLNKRESE